MKLLHKLFNENNLKLSYSYSSNMAKRINAHNVNVLATKDDLASIGRKCNYRDKEHYPLEGAWLIKNMQSIGLREQEVQHWC